MKRVVSLVLSILIFSMPVLASAASSYSDLIGLINDQVESMYNGANSAPQQTQAVAFGTMYMLQVIESEIDTDRSRTENVSSLVSSLTDSMSSAKGADQVSSLVFMEVLQFWGLSLTRRIQRGFIIPSLKIQWIP